MMTAEDRAIDHYDRLLSAIGDRADEMEPRPVASMWPHLGSAYQPGGLLLLGQALQGWDPDECSARWQSSEARSAEGRKRILAGTRAWHADAAEPIATVLEVGKRARSTFWLFSKTLVETLVTDERPWVSRYAWGNLYPVGWDKPGDSPWGALREAQDPFVGDLLRAEVDMLDPAEVVIICGPWFWRSASKPAGLDDLPKAEGPLIAAGKVDGRAWVVGYHPRYASQGFRVVDLRRVDIEAAQGQRELDVVLGVAPQALRAELFPAVTRGQHLNRAPRASVGGRHSRRMGCRTCGTSGAVELTVRERQTLELVARGLNAEIAERLVLGRKHGQDARRAHFLETRVA